MEEAKALAFFAGVSYVAKKIADPSLTHVGNRLRDLMFERGAEADAVAEEAKLKVERSGGQGHPVPGRILWKILEHSSADTGGELRDQWSSMLANESLRPGSVHPSYPQILSQLEPAEVKLLNFMLYHLARYADRQSVTISQVFQFSRDGDHMKRMIRNLSRLDVAVPSLHGGGFDHLDYGMMEEQTLRFSSLGLDFMKACVMDDPTLPPAPSEFKA